MMNNKIGMHCGYFRGTKYELDIFGMLDIAKKSGADVLELIPPLFINKPKEELLKFRDALLDAGIELSVCGGMFPEADISSDDPEKRKTGLEFAKKVMDTAELLGSKVWAGILYAVWPGRPASVEDILDKPRRTKTSITTMKEMVKIAEDKG